MSARAKNWDHHVIEAEQLADGDGFRSLRDRIIELSELSGDEFVADIGAGTGLLSLPVAHRARTVLAVDISPAMCDRVRAKAQAAGLHNVFTMVASATRLSLNDGSVDVAVSNYCFHHLSDADKERALAELFRVLRPGGRLVFADMMFRVGVVEARDRRVIGAKVGAMVRKGPAGLLRLAKNAGRFAAGRWEQPARADWWEGALARQGFVDVKVGVLDHEGGLASATRP